MLMAQRLADQFALPMRLHIRTAHQADLRTMAWLGAFMPAPALVATAFDRQHRGEVQILIAEVNGLPAGQLWIDLVQDRSREAARLSAIRVYPAIRRLGVTTHLLEVAERRVVRAGLSAALLTVDATNVRAVQFYERVGYRVEREVRGTSEFGTDTGQPDRLGIRGCELKKTVTRVNRRGSYY